MTEAVELLLPQPREVRTSDGTFTAGRLTLGAVPARLDTYRRAAQAAIDAASAPAREPTIVEVGHREGPSEGYALILEPTGVRLLATDAAGLLHGSRTLARLQQLGAGRLPTGRIDDWPALPVRGVFVESSRGADRMTLGDWRELVDLIAALSLNTLCISLYACWDRRHDGEPSEFLFAPLPSFPALSAERRVPTWDQATGEPIELDFVPPMYEGDFFGDVVAYAAERGVRVIPWFAGPGHSSLIPRTYPALSAKDDDGEATGFGYCTSDPEARRLLARLFDDLAVAHVVAHGGDELGVAADEYYGIANLRPDDPTALVSPICRCPGCRDRSAGEQLVEYLVLAGRALADHGVRMLHWHDSLVREGVLERYAERLAVEGLSPPTVAWWGYRHPIAAPDPAFESWVSPTTGLTGSLFLEDHAPNVDEWVREAHRAGATGVMAYTAPTPSFDRNLACLAELSWRSPGGQRVPEFKWRWSGLVGRDRRDDAAQAFALSDSFLGCHALVAYVLDHLLPYFASSPAGSSQYPRDVLAPLGATTPAFTSMLEQVGSGLRRAVELMPSGPSALRELDGTLERWRAEHERLIGHVELVLRLVELARVAHALDARGREQAVQQLERDATSFLQELRPTTPYQAPYVVREHWHLLRGLRAAVTALATDERRRPPARPASHPWLF